MIEEITLCYVKCDRCGETTDDNSETALDYAEDDAEDRGWTIVRGSYRTEHYCEECAP